MPLQPSHPHTTSMTPNELAVASTTTLSLTFDQFSDEQVAYAFDFLPLIHHTTKQIQHTSLTQNQLEDAKAVQLATSALVQKFVVARDLLQLLPNIDRSQQEQIDESAKLDELIARKKRMIEAYHIQAAKKLANTTD